MIGTILIAAGIVVLASVIWLIIGAVRYGTRTIDPRDYEDD